MHIETDIIISQPKITMFIFAITGPPETSKYSYIFNITSNSAIYVWEPGFSFGFHQFFHLDVNGEIINNITSHKEGSKQRHSIEDLQPDTEYIVSVFASNHAGSSGNSPPIIFHTLCKY